MAHTCLFFYLWCQGRTLPLCNSHRRALQSWGCTPPLFRVLVSVIKCTCFLTAGQFQRCSRRHQERDSYVERSCWLQGHVGHKTSRYEKPCDTRNESHAAARQVPSLHFAVDSTYSKPDPDSVTHKRALSVPRRGVHGLAPAFTAHDRRKSGPIVNEPNNIAVLHPCTSEGHAFGNGCPVQPGQWSALLRFGAKRVASLRGSPTTWRSSYWTEGQQEARRYWALFTAELAIACHNDRRRVSDWARSQDTF